MSGSWPWGHDLGDAAITMRRIIVRHRDARLRPRFAE
jgi:hypothetical protein